MNFKYKGINKDGSFVENNIFTYTNNENKHYLKMFKVKIFNIIKDKNNKKILLEVETPSSSFLLKIKPIS